MRIESAMSGKRLEINFDWMLPATPENRDKILAEIIRRANNAK